MIYLDTSVALAQMLAEDRVPPPSLWSEPLVSSRLLEYELWARINGMGLRKSHGDDVRSLVARISFVELTREATARSTEPFPIPVRTLDALHLAAMDFLRSHGQDVQLASYDKRLVAAAKRIGIKAVPRM